MCEQLEPLLGCCSVYECTMLNEFDWFLWRPTREVIDPILDFIQACSRPSSLIQCFLASKYSVKGLYRLAWLHYILFTFTERFILHFMLDAPLARFLCVLIFCFCDYRASRFAPVFKISLIKSSSHAGSACTLVQSFSYNCICSIFRIFHIFSLPLAI